MIRTCPLCPFLPMVRRQGAQRDWSVESAQELFSRLSKSQSCFRRGSGGKAPRYHWPLFQSIFPVTPTRAKLLIRNLIFAAAIVGICSFDMCSPTGRRRRQKSPGVTCASDFWLIAVARVNLENPRGSRPDHGSSRTRWTVRWSAGPPVRIVGAPPAPVFEGSRICGAILIQQALIASLLYPRA